MRLLLSEPRLLKESVSIISELVDEAKFKVDKDKIELIAMDPANVAMVMFKLLSSAFAEYDVPKDIELAVKLDSLNQILKRAKPTDVLLMELDEEKNRLKIRLKGESTRTFHIALIDLDEEEQKVPNLKFSASIKIPALMFNEAIEDVGVVGETVSLIAEPERFTIKAEGRMNAANIEVTADESTELKVGDRKKVVSKYSIEYLKKMIKGSRLTDTMLIELDDDYPMALEYIIIDRLMLRFVLAPRTDED